MLDSVPSRLAALTLFLAAPAAAGELEPPSEWTIWITNDNCPDYTWGYPEDVTRKAFADIVRGHLDEMARTDREADDVRDRYNMAVTGEALCFLETYPERRDELFRRIREGRLFISPFLCNSLWGFQGLEGALRTFYPARRLEREIGAPLDVAEHIEEPSLPWGMPTILEGCGIRWLSIAFLAYDTTWGSLEAPPLFIHEGPDGSRVRVVLDAWASGKANYTQGARILRDPALIAREWAPHYRSLGADYPLRSILASGTHGDISPSSGGQAREFAERIIAYRAGDGPHARLVNAILPQFTATVDLAERERPFLRPLRGCFGHSWDAWPVSLAKYAAGMREGERGLLAAEALASALAPAIDDLAASTAEDRERAEWCLAMLSDHAWNGTDEANRRHNATLRRGWSEELGRRARAVAGAGWKAVGLRPAEDRIVVFNPLGAPRSDPVRLEIPAGAPSLAAVEDRPSQVVYEDGARILWFLPGTIPGFAPAEFRLVPDSPTRPAGPCRATPAGLESDLYRIAIDPRRGGISSLVRLPGGEEVVRGARDLPLGATVHFDGRERVLRDVTAAVEAAGPIVARVVLSGKLGDIEVQTRVTLVAGVDRVELDIRVRKPPGRAEERLCHVFPVRREGDILRLDTTAAVVRPRPAPEGDLLPGADGRRFAVQGFVDASLPGGPSVTIAPLDAFLLRLDLEPLSFEALGNDQNHKEMLPDSNGETEFRFRYALRVRPGGWAGEDTFAWSREAASPFLVARGSLPPALVPRAVEVDPARAVATCLKPADRAAPGGAILRVREVAGRPGPLTVGLRGWRRAIRTDLLERDRDEAPIEGGSIRLEIRPHGLAAVRLLP